MTRMPYRYAVGVRAELGCSEQLCPGGGLLFYPGITSMAAIKSILYHCARLRLAGFAQLTLFLGIILLATPLRQERRIFWVLLQLTFLDALLVSLSAGDTRQRLRW